MVLALSASPAIRCPHNKVTSWPLTTIRAMAADLDLEQSPAPVLPDGAAYQQIMGVFDHEQRPLRARDLCLALDLPILPKHTEGTRAKLKRLVSLGFLDETEPGLFQLPRPHAPAAPA